MIGPVHSGKSTLTGRLIYECNGIDKKSNEQIKNKLVKYKKQKENITFPYSWVTDVSNRERDLGHTIDLAVKKIETPKSYITIIDSPGYSSGKIKGGNRIDHVQTMIVGLSQADFVVLVVSAEQMASTEWMIWMDIMPCDMDGHGGMRHGWTWRHVTWMDMLACDMDGHDGM